jgi:O-antigen/teichoic acid export membrane protein
MLKRQQLNSETVEDEKVAAKSTADDLSALLSSATLMLFLGSLGSVSRLVEKIVLARSLGPEAFGKVDISFGMMTIAVTVALLGFRGGIPRFMTRFEDRAEKRGAWIVGSTIAACLTGVITLVLFVNAERIAETLLDPSPPRDLLVIFIATIPFVVGLELAIAGIRGRENTIYRTYTRDLLYNGLRLSLITGLLFVGYDVIAVGYAYLIAAAVAFVIALWLFNRLLPIVGPFEAHTREMVTFSIPLVLSSMVSVLLSEIDTVMIGAYLPSNQAGIYGAAWPLASGVGVIVSSFGFLFLPLMSRLDANEKHDEVNRMYKTTTKWVFVAAFPAMLCLVVFTTDYLAAIFGPEYTAGGSALTILVLGSFTSASFGRCQATLSAFGYTRYIFGINTIAAVLNIALNAVLIGGYGPVPPFGIDGAAAATAISTITLNGLALIGLWYKSGVNPLSRTTIRTFVLLPVTLFPPTLLLASQATLPLPALVAIIPATGVVSVAVLAVTNSLQSEDEIPVELIEDTLGIRVPFIRRYIPDESAW